ncbi:hypothetical protein [Desulfopila sp. IMCC35008]|uniref:hypothetical protein n=1 Tax=Desulfopila sp. IMCC35008 TaxID=2653858 RepID=UPI0013D5FF2E|nr:hypothetical protein [Desulfopila sp. IMCC35008]
MKAKETRKVSFDCPVDVLERLDQLAKTADMPRQRLMANLIEVGVETLEECEMVGLFQFSLLIRNLKENMGAWSKRIRTLKSKTNDVLKVKE